MSSLLVECLYAVNEDQDPFKYSRCPMVRKNSDGQGNRACDAEKGVAH